MNPTCPRCGGPLGRAPRDGHCATCYAAIASRLHGRSHRKPGHDSNLPYSGPAWPHRGDVPARPVGAQTHA